MEFSARLKLVAYALKNMLYLGHFSVQLHKTVEKWFVDMFKELKMA